MPRFVILEHDHPLRHWDLMLEVSAVLKTWRLAKAPDMNGQRIAAEPIGDHRVFYLDYEGAVQGDRGAVTRWDAGSYESLLAEADQAFHGLLKGTRLQGAAVIERHGAGWIFRMM